MIYMEATATTAAKILTVAAKFGLQIQDFGGDKLVQLDNGWLIIAPVRGARAYRWILSASDYTLGAGRIVSAKWAADSVALTVHAAR